MPLVMKEDPKQAERQRLEVLAQAALLLDRSMLRELPKRPALLRECAAELATERHDILELALRTIGIELIDTEIVEATAKALERWDASTVTEGSDRDEQVKFPERETMRQSLTRRLGWESKKGTNKSTVKGGVWRALISDEAQTPDFLTWLLKRQTTDPAAAMVRLLSRYPMDPHVAQAFGEVYALIVDRTIERRVRRKVRK